MSAFDLMKKNKGKNITAVLDKIDSFKKRSYNNDADKYWKLSKDENGNGSAIIRFLAGNPEAENDPPFVRLYKYGFKGPSGQWYFEKSLESINMPDPMKEYNGKLWASGDEDKKAIANGPQKRKMVYVSNILVVKDPAHPENDGKVFWFEYGTKIFEKIQKMMKPVDEDEEAIDPFDLWTGVNFRLRAKKVFNFPNYDDSTFDMRMTPIAADDDGIEAIWNQRTNLSTLIDPSTFKTYEQLKERLDVVLGNVKMGGGAKNMSFDEDEPDNSNKQSSGNKFDFANELNEEFEPEMPSKKQSMPSVDEAGGEDEDEAFFQSLVKK